MTIAVVAHKATKKPMMEPDLRSSFAGVTFRINATSESFAKQTLIMNRNVAAYCSFGKCKLSAGVQCVTTRLK